MASRHTDPPCVLFDLDGTLVDSLASIERCWRETLPRFGLSVPSAAVIASLVGPPVDEAARHLAPDADATTLAAIVAAYRARSAQATDAGPFPGVPELLDDLAAEDWVLAIATSKSMEVVQPLLEGLGWSARFAVVEGTRPEELGTDKATVVGRALARLAPRTPVAMVGDRRHDVEGARAHGLDCLGVRWGYGEAPELTAAGVTEILATPAELLTALLSRARGPAEEAPG